MLFDQLVDPLRRLRLGQVTAAREYRERRDAELSVRVGTATSAGFNPPFYSTPPADRGRTKLRHRGSLRWRTAA